MHFPHVSLQRHSVLPTVVCIPIYILQRPHESPSQILLGVSEIVHAFDLNLDSEYLAVAVGEEVHTARELPHSGQIKYLLSVGIQM